MTTITNSQAASTVQPKSIHAGAYPVRLRYSNGLGAAAATTISNGDTILMGKIPHGATVIDLYFIHEAGNGDTGSVSVDINGTAVIASQSTSPGAVIRWEQNLPYTVSVSDDATVRYHNVKVQVDADYTLTNVFTVVAVCTNDP